MTASAHRLPILQTPGWAEFPRLVHGFCGRQGGASQGAFAELNMSLRVGDAAAAVRENWQRVTHAVGGAVDFVSMQQVHGTAVVRVEDTTTAVGEADAMVSRAVGIGLCVLTADCVPILLVAPDAGVIAVVHAGWRGTVAGIVERTVEQLTRTYAVDPAALHAALGPAILGCCYEVEVDIVTQLEMRLGRLPEAVARTRGRKAQLDLRRANTEVLLRCGLVPSRVTEVGPCTRCSTEEYFSYRAAGGTTGRQLSFIGWRAAA